MISSVSSSHAANTPSVQASTGQFRLSKQQALNNYKRPAFNNFKVDAANLFTFKDNLDI
jgi:hypothetical protein